jgi:hypothetical protein
MFLEVTPLATALEKHGPIWEKPNSFSGNYNYCRRKKSERLPCGGIVDSE